MPSYPLVSQIWQAVLKHPEGVWLHSRQGRMLRITVVGSVVATDAVLYVERIEGAEYARRINQSAIVQLFTFRQGSGQPLLQSFPVRHQGPPYYELEHAPEVVATEAIGGQTPSDDMLRKLKIDLMYAELIKDVK